jgi:hypothetical protein
MGYIINDFSSITNITGSSFIKVNISGWAGSYIIPAGFCIKRIYAKAGTGFNNFSAGNTAGTADLIDAVVITAGTTVAIDTTIIANTDDRIIYFTIDTIDETLTTYLKIYLDTI